MSLFITVDPNAPHDTWCGFWEGGACRCNPAMERALYSEHCSECDFLYGSGYNRCSCEYGSKCLYPNEPEHECLLMFT